MGKILNLGSLNIDNVYSVDHFVTPGETISSLKYEIFPGGKGLNQSISLSLAGGEVYHAGKIGKDGQWLIKILKDRGVNTDLIAVSGESTGHAIIQVNKKGQNCILLHRGANAEITDEYLDSVLEGFGKGDLLVLQNEVNMIGDIIDKAFEKGLEIAFNPSPMDDMIPKYHLEKITWFLLNEIEGNQITGETDPEKITDKMLAMYPRAKVVLTLGKEGVLYRDKNERCTHGIYDVPVVDTTAAGDTFTGFFLTCATSGLPIPEALRLASIASSIAVSKKGAAISIPTMDEVKQSKIQPLKL